MAEDLSFYTGTILFKEIRFTFSFDKTELRLIPPEEDKHLIEWDWKMQETSPGVFSFADPIPIEDPYLVGECTETKHRITMLVYIGMRRGELCGLEWKDIDFENATMSICRSSQYVGNKTIITKEPKTYAGIRKFTLSESACELLKQYRTWQLKQRIKIGDRWNESDRLFTAWDGSPINPDTVTDWFSKFIKKSDLPHVTLHSLRHSNATIMIAEGADVRTVSNRLGHANTATTLNIYTHALESKDREAAKAIENALRGVEKIG